MSQTLTAPARPTNRVHPLTGFVIVVAILAALLFGFALRTWTEPTHAAAPTISAPAPVVATVPAPICRVGRPC